MSEQIPPLYDFGDLLAGSVFERRDIHLNYQGELYPHIGLFISCYALVDLGLNLLIMRFLGTNRSDDVKILLDRVFTPKKIDKLKELMLARNWKFSPELTKILKHFAGPVTSLRNKLAHDIVMCVDGENMLVMDINRRMSNPREVIPLIDIFQHAEWCKAFSSIIADIDAHLGPDLGASPEQPKVLGLGDNRLPLLTGRQTQANPAPR